ncbi:MAG: c-type cytochrome [Cyclobacteriaceae bacterium]|nr:c-type cytochrome [Cyclobacteriaceae bacterium]
MYRSSQFYSLLVFLCAVLLVFNQSVYAQGSEVSDDPEVISTGKQLFDANCKQCHRIHEKYVGPALQDVYNRAPSLDWIRSFVKNPSKKIQEGDPYANSLFDEYKTMMTSFPLEDEQINAILSYIKDETAKGPATAAEVTQPGATDTAGTAETGPSAYFNMIMVGLVVILVLVFIVLLLILKVVKKYLGQQSDITEENKQIIAQKFSLNDIVKSKPFIFIAVFFVGALFFKGVINGLVSVGVQKGYAPTQPIAYSHQLHAGQYGIDCNYCHTGVRKSRSANIPSANICMNCHSSILPESPEIQKIKASIDNNKPIEWVRIHNLPDLAYFNHAQHVEVGGVECQTCHGQVQEMAVVRQENLLTMGWCIDCHRKTEVNGKDNAYYDNLMDHHNGKMTVEDMGGLECSKCHY